MIAQLKKAARDEGDWYPTATAGIDYVAAAGTVTFAPGTTTQTLTVRVLADTAFGEDSEAFAVQLAPSGQGLGIIVDDNPWPSVTSVAVAEGNADTAVFSVTLPTAKDRPVTFTYATANGSATAGSDFMSASGTLTFAPGETSKSLTVLVNGDWLGEPNETFFVNLSNPNDGVIADGQGQGTIVDDEPRISISDVSKAEGKARNTTLFTFTVTLSAAYDQAVTMSYRTANGTATTGDNDYIAKTGTLTFAPGETTKSITIEVKADSKSEANETFYLDLYGLSSNGLLTKSRGIGTILSDD